MENVMRYNEFTGSVRYNAEDKVFHGRIEFIADLVTFEGTTVSELEAAFIEAVEDYLELCQTIGKQPEKNFTGSFNVRIKPELNRQAAITALEKGVSLNQLVAEAVHRYVGR